MAAAALLLLGVRPPAAARSTTLHELLRRGGDGWVQGWPAPQARPREAAGRVAARVAEHLSRLADLGLLLADMSAERVVFLAGGPGELRLETAGAASAAREQDRTWRAFEARRLLLLALPLAALALHVAATRAETPAAEALQPFREALASELQDLLATFTIPVAPLARETFEALTGAVASALGRHMTLAPGGAGAAGDVLARRVLEQHCGVRFTRAGGAAGAALGARYDGTLRSPRGEGATYLSLEVLQWSPPTATAARFARLAAEGRVVVVTTGSADDDHLPHRARHWLEDTQALAGQALHAAQLRAWLAAGGGPPPELRAAAEADAASAEAFVAHACPPLELRGLLAFEPGGGEAAAAARGTPPQAL
jgi:hypothetical protein